MTVKDHLGHEFHSQKAMAEYWGVKYVTFMHRKNNLHWSVERSLTADLNTNTKLVYDHLGNPYPSMSAMARHYGLGISTLAARLSIYKWPLEKALTTPIGPTGPGARQVKDHKGKIYPSTKAMAEAYHISYASLQDRLRRGWPLEKALTTPMVKQGANSKPAMDYKGKIYPSKKAMAEAYNISPEVLYARLYLGWPLKKALTQPKR